jgi:exopolysaccharide biosynthesis polyprenyl glycosylphosphotransferase
LFGGGRFRTLQNGDSDVSLTSSSAEDGQVSKTLPADGTEAREDRSRLIWSPGGLFLVNASVLAVVLLAARLLTGFFDPIAFEFTVITLTLLARESFGEKMNPSALDDAFPITARVAAAYGIAAATQVMTGVGEPLLSTQVAIVSLILLVSSRTVFYGVQRFSRSRTKRSRTLILGAGDIGRRIIESLAERQDYGLQVVGVVDDDPKYGESELGIPILGGLSDVEVLLAERGIGTVIVAFGSGRQADLVKVMRSAVGTGADVWMVPRLFEVGVAGHVGDHIWGMPIVRLQGPARNRFGWGLKRVLDIVVSAVAVILLSPWMALFAAAIYLSSGRPILLRQERIGLDGQSFTLLKFRSMRVRDQDVEGTEWRPDTYDVTAIGRFLRNTSLDELPQLFNVLRGDMSLVGPRPERPYFVGLFSELYPQYNDRHRLPAGLTGWAQVNGLRGDTSIEERVIFDNYYIENWSIGQDLRILIRTISKLAAKW